MNYLIRKALAKLKYQAESDSIEREKLEYDYTKVKETNTERQNKILQLQISKAKCIEEIARLDIEYYKSTNNIV